MPRDQLDLRGLSLAELQAKDAEIGDELNSMLDGELMNYDGSPTHRAKPLLADRRQLRARMEELIVLVKTNP